MPVPGAVRISFASCWHLRSLTKRAYGANFVLDFPIDERLGIALEHGVPVISFFWGDGSPHLARVKAAGAVAIQVVGSVDDAKRAADAGFDLIVAQGLEAGGHVRGSLGTMALVPQVVDAVTPLPVLAGGGIADRRGVKAAIELGAAGVWVGTRFPAARKPTFTPTIWRAFWRPPVRTPSIRRFSMSAGPTRRCAA